MADATWNRWKALREIAGLSQREVERRCGFGNHGWLSLVERGVPPTEEQAARLTAVLLKATMPARLSAKGEAS